VEAVRLQVLQGREAGAEVVERQADAERMQPVELVAQVQ
jgi:hypothetical protein